MISGGAEVFLGAGECFVSVGFGCGLGLLTAAKGLDNAATGFTNYGKHPSEQNVPILLRGYKN